MFVNKGILSIIVAGWIAFGNKEKFRYYSVIATLFFVSVAVLPFLTIYFWKNTKKYIKYISSTLLILIVNWRINF